MSDVRNVKPEEWEDAIGWRDDEIARLTAEVARLERTVERARVKCESLKMVAKAADLMSGYDYGSHHAASEILRELERGEP